MTKTIAALYVATNGPYYNLEGVLPFDINDDARMYMGPHPVVAHPPYPRWGKFWKGQPGNIKAGKVERLGDDYGCFKCALFDVRRFGGVLEHPEGSHAWAKFGLTKPPVWAGGSEQTTMVAGPVGLSKASMATTVPSLPGFTLSVWMRKIYLICAGAYIRYAMKTFRPRWLPATVSTIAAGRD